MKAVFLVPFAAAALVLGACAPAVTTAPVAVQVPAPIDPVGTWDITADAQGTPVRGVMVIQRAADDALSGLITTDVAGEVPLRRITVDGRHAEARTPMTDGELVIRMHFEQDHSFTGSFQMGSDLTGTIAGERRRTGS